MVLVAPFRCGPHGKRITLNLRPFCVKCLCVTTKHTAISSISTTAAESGLASGCRVLDQALQRPLHGFVEIGVMAAAPFELAGHALEKCRTLFRRQAGGGGHHDLQLRIGQREHGLDLPQRGQ